MINNEFSSTMNRSEFGWGTPIMNIPRVILLDEGYYEFRVLSFEKSYYNGSKTALPCPVAKLKLEIIFQNKNTIINHNLFLNDYSQFKIYDFFDSIGLAEKGSFTPQWDEVVGRMGECYLIQKELDYKTINVVDRFIPRENAKEGGEYYVNS